MDHQFGTTLSAQRTSGIIKLTIDDIVRNLKYAIAAHTLCGVVRKYWAPEFEFFIGKVWRRSDMPIPMLVKAD